MSRRTLRNTFVGITNEFTEIKKLHSHVWQWDPISLRCNVHFWTGQAETTVQTFMKGGEHCHVMAHGSSESCFWADTEDPAAISTTVRNSCPLSAFILPCNDRAWVLLPIQQHEYQNLLLLWSWLVEQNIPPTKTGFKNSAIENIKWNFNNSKCVQLSLRIITYSIWDNPIYPKQTSHTLWRWG